MNDTSANTDMGTPTNTGAPQSPVESEGTSTRSLIIYTIAALGLAFFIRFFIAAPYVVSGASMIPTFYDYHYLIIDRVTYGFEEPQRGDVIVLDLPQDTSRALIKRVIGLPGETVSLEGNKVIINNAAHPQGFQLDESYIAPDNFGGPTDMQVTLGPDEFFVLGDNRRVSADSRSWGKLPRRDIVGRAILRLFPFNKIGILPGTVHFDDSSITNDNS